MKIGIFTDTYWPDTNGVAVLLKQLKPQIEALGHKLYIVAPGSNLKTIYDAENCVLRLPGISMERWSGIKWNYTEPSKKYQNLIVSWNLDLIHTHSEFFVGNFALKTAKKLNIPLFHTFHTMWNDYVDKSNVTLLNKKVLYKIIEKRILKFISASYKLIVPTDKTVGWIKKFVGSDQKQLDKIIVLSNGVNLDTFLSHSSKDLGNIKEIRDYYDLNNHFIAGYVGRLVNEKSSFELLKYCENILHETKEFKFVFVGDGALYKKAKNYVLKHNIWDRIILTGRVFPGFIKYFYQTFDLFIANSTSETQGLTYIEAAASGLPLLSVDDPMLQKIIKVEKNGYFFKNYEDFRKKLYYLKSIKNTNKYKVFSNNSILIANQFKIDLHCEKLLKIYETINS